MKNSVSGILFTDEITITENGQTIIPLTKAYVVGVGMITVYRNGVLLQKSTYKETTSKEIVYTDTENPLVEGDIISVRHHLTSGLKIGNLRLVSNYGDLEAIKDPEINEVVIITSTKSFYHYGEDGWQEWVLPLTSQNIGLMFDYEKQEITDGLQMTYEMQEVSYHPGMGNLLVFVNGKLWTEYTEVDEKTILFNVEELPTGDIEFIVANTDSWEDSVSHDVDYNYDSQGNIVKSTHTVDGREVKSSTFLYNGKGDIVKEIKTQNLKTIIKEFSYNSAGDIVKVSVNVI